MCKLELLFSVRSRVQNFLLIFATSLTSSLAASAEHQIDGRNFLIFPSEPSANQPIVISTLSNPCGGVTLEHVDIVPQENRVRVALREIGLDISPCIAPSYLLEIPVEGVTEEGIYLVELYQRRSASSGELFNPIDFLGSFEFSINTSLPVYNAETPIQGQTYSGIGIVRGWACNAETVTIQFNDSTPLVAAYGSSRPDTQGVCGDDTNGYGVAFAWGNLGNGTHVAKTVIDGINVSEVEFTVSGLDEPFMTGLSAEYVLQDFPTPGESVVVRWSQPDQNFIIVDHPK